MPCKGLWMASNDLSTLKLAADDPSKYYSLSNIQNLDQGHQTHPMPLVRSSQAKSMRQAADAMDLVVAQVAAGREMPCEHSTHLPLPLTAIPNPVLLKF